LQRDVQKILEKQGVLMKMLADSDAEKLVSKPEYLILQKTEDCKLFVFSLLVLL